MRHLPKLNNFRVPERHHSPSRPMLYGFQSLSTKKARIVPPMPNKLSGSSMHSLAAPIHWDRHDIHASNCCNDTAVDFYYNLNHNTTTYTGIATDLYGYYVSDTPPSVSDNEHGNSAGSSQIISSVSPRFPNPEKIMLTSYSRPTSTAQQTHKAIHKVAKPPQVIVVPGTANESAVSKARPNSARRFDTTTSMSYSPSPPYRPRNDPTTASSCSSVGQAIMRSTKDFPRESPGICPSAVYSLSLPQDSPHIFNTPLYELPSQFFLRTDTPQRNSPHNACTSNSDLREGSDMNCLRSNDSSSPFSLQQFNSPDTFKCTQGYVTMDQLVDCIRLSSALHPSSTRRPLSYRVPRPSKRPASAHVKATAGTGFAPRDSNRDIWLDNYYTEHNRMPKMVQFTAKTALIPQRPSSASCGTFQVVLRSKDTNMHHSQNMQQLAGEVNLCANKSKYIQNLLERRSFYPYPSPVRRSTSHSQVLGRQ